MDSLLTRYRNVTVLVLVIMAQLVLLAFQVRTGNDVRLIRVWAVTAVTPLAKALESTRSGLTNAVNATPPTRRTATLSGTAMRKRRTCRLWRTAARNARLPSERPDRAKMRAPR